MQTLASLLLHDDKRMLAPALAFIDQFSAGLGLDSARILKFRMACEEILLDRIEHAYADGGEIRVDLGLSGSNLEVSVVDKGSPYWKGESGYDPGAADTAAVGLEDFLIAKMADQSGMEKLGRNGQRFYLQAALPAPPLPAERSVKEEIPLDRDFAIRPTRPDGEDIIKAIACIHNEYGYSYGYERLYYPERFRELIAQGGIRSYLAVNRHGQVAGHYGMVFSDLVPGMPEMATVVIRRAFRGNQLFDAMMRHFLDTAPGLGAEALMMQPTAYHTATQHLALRYGFVPTGFLFQYTNPDMISEYNPDGRRLDLAVAVKALDGKKTAVVHPPPELGGFLKDIYQMLGVDREWRSGGESAGPAEMQAEINSLMRSGKIVVWRSGNDFGGELSRLTREFLRNKLEMIELLMSLDDPATPAAYAKARELGYFFTGLMPCGGRGDYLMLQHLSGGLPEPGSLATEGEFKEILDAIVSLGEKR